MNSRWNAFKSRRRLLGRAFALGFPFALIGGAVGTFLLVGVSLILALSFQMSHRLLGQPLFSSPPTPPVGLQSLTDVIVGFLLFGLLIGGWLAAPLTIVIFPLLFIIFPDRKYSTLALVTLLSGVGGFASPYLASPRMLSHMFYRVNVAPAYNVIIDQTAHTIHVAKNPEKDYRCRLERSAAKLGLLGMTSALIIAPFYFFATRREARQHPSPDAGAR